MDEKSCRLRRNDAMIEKKIFNKDGEAVAYITPDYTPIVYLWDGNPVAYIYEKRPGARNQQAVFAELRRYIAGSSLAHLWIMRLSQVMR